MTGDGSKGASTHPKRRDSAFVTLVYTRALNRGVRATRRLRDREAEAVEFDVDQDRRSARRRRLRRADTALLVPPSWAIEANSAPFGKNPQNAKDASDKAG